MKNTKTVLILAAVTGALLLGGCGSEKQKHTSRRVKIFLRKLQVCPGGVPEFYPERGKTGTVLPWGGDCKPASWQI